MSPQAVSTWLEPLFNHNTYTSQRCTRLMYQAAQPLRGLAHGHKVIDHQHPVCCRQVFPGYADGIHPTLGIGADSRRILLCPSLVAPRTLLGKDQRHLQPQGYQNRKSDTRCLNSQHFADMLALKPAGKFICNRVGQHRIDLMIQKRIHLYDSTGQSSPLPANPLLQKLHALILLNSA